MMTKDSDVGALVLQQEARRFDHMLHGRMDDLRQLLDPDLLYVHSSSDVDDTESYLELFGKGITYLELRPTDQSVTVIGIIALIDGLLRLRAAIGGSERTIESRTLSVWVRREEEWRLLRWHAVPVTAGAGLPGRKIGAQ